MHDYLHDHKDALVKALDRAFDAVIIASIEGIPDDLGTVPDEELDWSGWVPRIVFVNHAATVLTGYSAAELTSLTLSDFNGPDTRPERLTLIRRRLLNGQVTRVNVRQYRKDGTMYWAEITGVPVMRDGVLTHVIQMQRDITAQRETEAAMKAKIGDLRQRLDHLRAATSPETVRRALHDYGLQTVLALGVTIRGFMQTVPEHDTATLESLREQLDFLEEAERMLKEAVKVTRDPDADTLAAD